MKFPLGLMTGVVCSCATMALPTLAQPLGTAFTYQGELRQAGNPATGLYDLRFRLYDSSAAGVQIGPVLCADNVSLSAGRFTIQLDFGAQFAGQQRFLEMDVRQDTGLDCSNAAGFVLLSPRQSLAAAPNAVYSLTAGAATTATIAATAANATQLNSQPASYYTNAANLTGALPSTGLSGTYSNALSLSNVSNSFAGSGAGLTTLNASSFTSGTLNPARFPIPLALSGNAPSSILSAINTSAAFATGLSGTADGIGVSGLANSSTGATFGGRFQSTSDSGFGVAGFALGQAAVYGEMAGPFGYGVHGVANHPSGSTIGVWGQSVSTQGIGVQGSADAQTGPTIGVFGISNSPDGVGVQGMNFSSSGASYGIYGTTNSPSGAGVQGTSYSTTGATSGLAGVSNSTQGSGVYGLAAATSGATYGVQGQTSSTAGFGIYGVAPAAVGTAGRFTNSTYTTNLAGPTFGLSTNGPVIGTSFQGSGAALTDVTLLQPTSPGSTQTGNLSINGIGSFASVKVAGGVQNGGASPVPTTDLGLYSETAGNWLRLVANAAPIQFFTDGGPGTNPTMTVSEQGNVGIGTQAPAGKLNVVGDANWTALYALTSGSGNAVYARASTTSNINVDAIFAQIDTPGTGSDAVFATATSSTGFTNGVVGNTNSPNGFGVFSSGRFGASGTKSFRIDHPADPENKYLMHYCSEGPDPLNVYTGKVALNDRGEAIVDLPAYFAAINKDPRYTLTALGTAMPLLHIAQEIDDAALATGSTAGAGDPIPSCTFRIAGGAPGGRVSWRIDALRNDRFVQQHGAPVESEKPEREKGLYQHPDLYGQPPERGMNHHAAPDQEAHP